MSKPLTHFWWTCAIISLGSLLSGVCDEPDLPRLPVAVEVEARQIEGKDMMVVELTNVSSGKLWILKDFLGRARFDIRAQKQRVTSDGKLERGPCVLGKLVYSGIAQSRAEKLSWMKHAVAKQGIAVALEPGDRIEAAMPLSDALREADALKGAGEAFAKVSARVYFREVILDGAGYSDEERLSLFGTMISTPLLDFENGVWSRQRH